MKNKFPIAAAALALLIAACSTDESQLGSNIGDDSNAEASTAPAGPVWFIGTVHHLPDNGGVWVVRTASGRQYQPNGLPQEFQVEGLAVEVEARAHEKVITKDTLGQEIDIVEIRKQGSASN